MSAGGFPEVMELGSDVLNTGIPDENMTEDEFETWVLKSSCHAEWIDGRVIPMAPANLKHVQLTVWIQSLLLIVVQHDKLGEVLGPEFMVRLRKGEKSRRVPDILFVSAARRSFLKKTYLNGPPDIAIEVVSPDSVARDWREKYLVYEAEGVQEYWIIDPLSKTLEAYTLKRKKFRLISPAVDGTIGSPLIPHFRLQPSWLWQDSLPSVLDVLRELGMKL